MKYLKDYKNYQGNDIDLATSLFEYGLIWTNDHKDCDKSKNEYQFIYGVCIDDHNNYTHFDHAFTTENDFNKLLKESWFDLPAVLSFCGKDKLSFPENMDVLIAYYGTQNIFGSSYEGIQILENEMLSYYFNSGIEIEMSVDDCLSMSEQSNQYENVKAMLPKFEKQFENIDNEDILRELKSTGIEKETLTDTEENKIKLLWIAACNIKEEYKLS
jgi:hypothetical protein